MAKGSKNAGPHAPKRFGGGHIIEKTHKNTKMPRDKSSKVHGGYTKSNKEEEIVFHRAAKFPKVANPRVIEGIESDLIPNGLNGHHTAVFTAMHASQEGRKAERERAFAKAERARAKSAGRDTSENTPIYTDKNYPDLDEIPEHAYYKASGDPSPRSIAIDTLSSEQVKEVYGVDIRNTNATHTARREPTIFPGIVTDILSPRETYRTIPEEETNKDKHRRKPRLPPAIWLLPPALALLISCPPGADKNLTSISSGGSPDPSDPCWKVNISGNSVKEVETRKNIANIAAGFIGQHEIPGRENEGPIVEYSLKGGKEFSYCTAFAARCYEEAAPGLLPYSWWSGDLAKAARKANAYYIGERHANFVPQTGDILITKMDSQAQDGEKKQFHTRIVLCSDMNDNLLCISANKSDPEGKGRPDGVYLETLPLSLMQEAIKEGITGCVSVGGLVQNRQQQTSLAR